MVDVFSHSCCIEFSDQRPEVVCVENQSRYVLYNSSKTIVSKIRVDNCLPYFNNRKKCDFIIHSKSKTRKHLYLIELKGKDIKRALQQIDDTLLGLNISIKSGFNEVHGRIIPTKTPNIIGTNFQTLDNKFRALNGKLVSRTNNYDNI